MDKDDTNQENKNQNEPSEALLLLWLTVFIVSTIALKVVFF
jgi:hypothetical protein